MYSKKKPQAQKKRFSTGYDKQELYDQLCESLDAKLINGDGDRDSITLPLVDKDGKEFEKTFHFKDDDSWIYKKLHPDLRSMIDQRKVVADPGESPEKTLLKIKEEAKIVKSDLLKEGLTERQIKRKLHE